jgi:hypothetical protein
MTSIPSRGEARVSAARSQTTVTLSLGEFQAVALTRALRSLRAVLRQAEVVAGQVKFEKREPSPLLTSAGPRELADEITRAAAASIASHPSKAPEIERIARSSVLLAHARTALDALRAYHDVVDLPDGGSSVDAVHFSADRLRVYVTVTALGDDEGDYLASMSALFGEARAARRSLTASEYAALDVADWRLRGGVPFRTPFSCLGTSGFRAVQTWLSLADPGPDHTRITAFDAELLRGLIAHVEHIDRDMISDKEKIEPYRLPAAWHAARVRLRVGEAVPCTAFVGRPLFENHAGAGAISDAAFEMDLLKTAHLHASACTAMFVNGVTDCKIAIERMTRGQAVRFMRALSGNVLRDRDRQTLSAAFNLNTPLEVEEGGVTRTVSERFEIGMAGVALAREGGFEKIAWDGASNEVPSRPIVQQISHEELVDLVHAAHENGLETYVSAGMLAEHMKDAAFAGVDGVGIGTSMHHVDPETKLMGALKPDAIRAALRVRDEAEAHPQGRAARALARLDQMHFEGSLGDGEEETRAKLHRAVRSKDEALARACAAGIARAERLDDVDLLDNPTLARGRRRLALLRLDRGAPAQASELGEALDRHDAVTVRELLHDADRPSQRGAR